MARPGGNPDRPVLPAGPGRPKGSKNKITRERWELEVRRIALIDVASVFERVKDPATGKVRRYFTLREVHAMDADTRACIASIKVRTENLTAGDKAQDETVEIKFWDKLKALELGARANGWLKDVVQVEGLSERKERLRRALARPAGDA